MPENCGMPRIEYAPPITIFSSACVIPRLRRFHTNLLSTLQDLGGVATVRSIKVAFVAQLVRVRLLQRHDLCIYK